MSVACHALLVTEASVPTVLLSKRFFGTSVIHPANLVFFRPLLVVCRPLIPAGCTQDWYDHAICSDGDSAVADLGAYGEMET